MKSSGIGGQAVLEGIMMRNQDRYSVAVRKPDGGIAVAVMEYKSVASKKKALSLPFIRGIFSFIDSLAIGIKCLLTSAKYFEEEQEKAGSLTPEIKKKQERKEKAMMVGIVTVSLIFAVGLFIAAPYLISALFKKFIPSRILLTVLEGVIRILFFLLYLVGISSMKDIKRTFMYHGAEHKCINCIEHGMELKTENVRISSKEHKRCGTSFLFFVMLVTICFCFLITAKSFFLRLLYRILLLPVVAGVSYELLKLAGRSDNFFVNLLSRPGLWVQNFTTREPDDSMIEVAICAIEAVFDWKKFLAENFGSQSEGDGGAKI